MRSALLMLVLLILSLSFYCLKAEPLYSNWITDHYELILVYDNEAIPNNPYTITVDFTALMNMTIAELKISLWLIYDSYCRLLHEQIIIQNTTISVGWSKKKTFTTTISIVPPPTDPLLLLKVFLKYKVNSNSHILEYSGAILPVRARSYRDLVDEVAELSSKVKSLERKLDEKEEKLNSTREELYVNFKSRYEEVSKRYEELSNAYKELGYRYSY
ncbi:MAG: hypothetical protein DRN53_02740 [Thermoprotei archaeon]|nr:MAG: hypothetical protein DRN53_02740 [Thermoprotei archaeon]